MDVLERSIHWLTSDVESGLLIGRCLEEEEEE